MTKKDSIFLWTGLAFLLLAIISIVIRFYYYYPLAGSLGDFLWMISAVLMIYYIFKNSYLFWITIIIILMMAITSEFFQAFANKQLNIFAYYPGWGDIYDLIAYLFGFFLGLVIIYIIKKVMHFF